MIAARWMQDGTLVACAFFNPNAEAVTVTLPQGRWTALLGASGSLSGSASVEGRGTLLVKK